VDQAADGQEGAQDHGGVGHELAGVAQQPVLAVLSRAVVAAGRNSTNANGMITSENSMSTKMMTAMTWVAVEDFR
jgi:hypothetical protein